MPDAANAGEKRTAIWRFAEKLADADIDSASCVSVVSVADSVDVVANAAASMMPVESVVLSVAVATSAGEKRSAAASWTDKVACGVKLHEKRVAISSAALSPATALNAGASWMLVVSDELKVELADKEEESCIATDSAVDIDAVANIEVFSPATVYSVTDSALFAGRLTLSGMPVRSEAASVAPPAIEVYA